MSRRQTIARLAREFNYYPRLALAMLLGTLAGVLSLVPPWAFGEIVNKVLNPAKGHAPQISVLYVALGSTLVALILAQLATYGQTYLTAWCGLRFISRMRQRLFERVIALPLREFDRWRPGELIARFNSDLQIMADAVSVSLPQLVVALVTFVSSLAVMIYMDWLLTLSLILVAPLISFAVSKFQALIRSSMESTQQRIADMSSALSEMLQGQRIVKAFGREAFESQRFREHNVEYFNAFMKLTQFVQTQPLVVSTVMACAVVVVIWLSAREVLVGRLDVGEILKYWLLVVNLVNPINRLAAFVGDVSKAIVSTSRAYEILDLPVEVQEVPEARPLRDVRGRVEFLDLTFSYEAAAPPALDNISVAIEAGEIAALVGPSGSGKTTFVNLVPRFYEPQHGHIFIDGNDIASVRLSDLRSAIAIVPQDPQLFRGSVMDNIRYGRLDATDAEVIAAAREANADEFIAQLPERYDTEVGERGVRLSGGQRQRIAIARAILRDPRILILDEATSALDTHSEAMIEDALDRLLPGRTTLIIAHRLSTIRRADKVLYIESGKLLEFGTQEELLARNGHYARLHAAQFSV